MDALIMHQYGAMRPAEVLRGAIRPVGFFILPWVRAVALARVEALARAEALSDSAD